MFGTVVTVESKEHVVKVSNLNDEYEEHYDLESRLRSTSVYFLSITPMASLESLDQVGLLVRSTFHRVRNITSQVLHISGKIFFVKCAYCTVNFETELNMLVHVRFVHTFRNTPVSDGEEFKFELCLELL